jgi:hypothetical protein
MKRKAESSSIMNTNDLPTVFKTHRKYRVVLKRLTPESIHFLPTYFRDNEFPLTPQLDGPDDKITMEGTCSERVRVAFPDNLWFIKLVKLDIKESDKRFLFRQGETPTGLSLEIKNYKREGGPAWLGVGVDVPIPVIVASIKDDLDKEHGVFLLDKVDETTLPYQMMDRMLSKKGLEPGPHTRKINKFLNGGHNRRSYKRRRSKRVKARRTRRFFLKKTTVFK